MKNEILKLLSEVERRHRVEIVYACESGSRAWGFHSPDSDYDIRFIYRRDMESYLSVFPVSDTIETPIENDLDPGGWNLQKALRLLGPSNGALIEWFHSPIVYMNREDFCQRMQILAGELVQLDRLRHHYLGMAKQVSINKLQEPEPSAKSYLYALRALLAAKWIETTQTIPPVRLIEMLGLASGELRKRILELLQAKANLGGTDTAGKLLVVSQFVTSSMNSKKDWIPNKVPSSQRIESSLNKEFLSHLTLEPANEIANG